jgi:hypothetical protein
MKELLKENRLLLYNIFSMIKLFMMIALFFIGVLLIIGEPIIDGLLRLIFSKAVGFCSIWIAYQIFEKSSNRLRDLD